MFTLTITYNPKENTLSVDGPIRDTVLTYGMLERAKDVVREFVAQQKTKRKQSGNVVEFRADEYISKN